MRSIDDDACHLRSSISLRIAAWSGLTTLALLVAVPALADDAPVPATTGTETVSTGVGAYFEDWFKRVDAALASQPSFASPLVTSNPLLLELVQYDQYWQTLPTGARITNYDAGKGVHLIPEEDLEVFLQVPPYLQRTSRSPVSGFADWPVLTAKYRIASGNAENGNYVISAFLGGQAPTGIAAFTTDAYFITPTIGFAKGWGDFDVQATIGTVYPTDHIATLGVQLATNAVLQYHLLRYFWPEVEVNDTDWLSGVRGGKNQVFLTPGIVVGALPVYDRLTAAVGFGYQFAVSPKPILNPTTPLYNHSWIMTLRLFF